VVEPTLVGTLVEFLQERPDAGVVGPKTLSTTPAADGRPRRLYAGAWRTVLPLIQNIPGIEQPDEDLPDRPIPTDYVWGHGMMLRAAAIREVGAFDPAFFMYCEDLDLCVRLRRAGHGVWCEPRAVMWHDIPDGARAERSESWRWACKVRSIGVFHRKHARWPAAPLLTLATVLVEAKRLLARRRFRAAGHLLGAYAGIPGRGEP
jgi:GT2 family glycosyltransferase